MKPALLEAIRTEARSAVLEGLREHMWSNSPGCVHQFPQPHAIESEELIVSSLLCGHVKLADVRPLVASSFFVPLHRQILQALEGLGAVDDVAAGVVSKLYALGCTGLIEQAVFELRDRVPYILHLGDHVARVHEASRKRRLSEWLMELDADLRLERITADEAIAKMRTTVVRGKRAV